MNYSDENKFIELIGKIPNVAVQGYNKEREVISLRYKHALQ